MLRRRKHARCSATSSASYWPTTATATWTSPLCAAETAASRAGSAAGPTSNADADDRLEYAGIRYLSRLSSEWECWALFEDAALDEQERRPITRDDHALTRIAELYGLTVF